MARYLVTENANTHGSFHHSRRTDETVLEARCALADLFHARRPEEIVFGPNMTALTFHDSRARSSSVPGGFPVRPAGDWAQRGSRARPCGEEAQRPLFPWQPDSRLPAGFRMGTGVRAA